MFSQDLFSQSLVKEKRTEIDKLQKAEEKRKLKEEIDNWKSLRTKIKTSLESYKNVRPFPDRSCIDVEQNPNRNLKKVLDVIEIWRDELYRYSGIHCTKYDQDGEYRFEFVSSKKGLKKETYFVQIFEVERKGILGVWKMPMLLDVNKILLNCPIDNISQVKNFVRLCKYYIECQENRETQFEALKAYVEKLRICSVQANLEIYTCIQLQIFKIREIAIDKFYDVVLYIVYELNECRPNKLITDSLHEEPLSEDVIKKLRTFFKHFKLLELKPAFEKIVTEQNGEFFQWEKALKDKDLVIESEVEESVCFSQEEENDLSKMRSFSDEGEGNKESSQQSLENNKNQRLKKTTAKEKKTNKKQKIQSSQNEDKNTGLQRKNEKADKKEKPNLRKRRSFKKVANSGNLEIEKLGISKKSEVEENLEKTEEDNVEKIKTSQTTKKVSGKKQPKITKNSVKSGKQTKFDFSRKSNTEQTEDLNLQVKELEKQDKNEETEIDKEANQLQKIDQRKNLKLQRSRSKKKTKDKKKETESLEKLDENQNEENSKEQNKKPPIENLKSDKEIQIDQSNIEAASSEEPEIKESKGRGQTRKKTINMKKKDKNTSHLGAKKTGTQKGNKLKSQIPNESIKRSFNLSNFVLKRKPKKNLLKTGSTLIKSTALAEDSKSSTPIPGRKQSHFQIDTEISEIIKINKPICQSPEKRPRISDSSDSEHEETVDEPNQNLLKNLKEIKEKALNVGNNKKEKKSLKRAKKGTKKARIL